MHGSLRCPQVLLLGVWHCRQWRGIPGNRDCPGAPGMTARTWGCACGAAQSQAGTAGSLAVMAAGATGGTRWVESEQALAGGMGGTHWGESAWALAACMGGNLGERVLVHTLGGAWVPTPAPVGDTLALGARRDVGDPAHKASVPAQQTQQHAFNIPDHAPDPTRSLAAAMGRDACAIISMQCRGGGGGTSSSMRMCAGTKAYRHHWWWHPICLEPPRVNCIGRL